MHLSVTHSLLLPVLPIVTTEWVPRIAYQTLLDIYNMISITVLMMIVVENLIMTLLINEDIASNNDAWPDSEVLESADEIFFLLIGCSW